MRVGIIRTRMYTIRCLLRALYVENGTEAIALVSADILWFREGIEDRIHETLGRELGLTPIE